MPQQQPPVTPDAYLAHCKRHFGSSNPERMHNPVWQWMVREQFYTPDVVREQLGLEFNFQAPGDPDWCFERFGAPKVQMPDGRVITIAGEHEDSYDPDFCIYNDIIVEHGDDIEIYGYPKSVFSPTDFHTATLVGETIWLIGSLGYIEERGGDHPQVFLLDTETYRIEPMATTGDSPGWIHNHTATLLEDSGMIEIAGGIVVRQADDNECFRDNHDIFRLDLQSGVWTQTTDHSNWRQFSLKYDMNESLNDLLDGGVWFTWYSGEAITDLGYPYDLHKDTEEACDDEDDSEEVVHTLFVDGVPVRCKNKYNEIRITIEGELNQSTVDELLRKLSGAAAKTQRTVAAIKEL